MICLSDNNPTPAPQRNTAGRLYMTPGEQEYMNQLLAENRTLWIALRQAHALHTLAAIVAACGIAGTIGFGIIAIFGR